MNDWLKKGRDVFYQILLVLSKIQSGSTVLLLSSFFSNYFIFLVTVLKM